MLTHNLGYPRIGAQRQLKKACEAYWAGKISLEQLQEAGKLLRKENWLIQRDAGIDLIPCNDFSFYDHVLDMTLAVGAIPERYRPLVRGEGNAEMDLYFAMARGYQAQRLGSDRHGNDQVVRHQLSLPRSRVSQESGVQAFVVRESSRNFMKHKRWASAPNRSC